ERDLQRRKLGYGRGGRMAIEPEKPRILSGVRHGKTLGAPLGLLIEIGYRDLRNSLERASARETAMRVALAAAARRLLDELDVRVGSWVTSIGSARARDVSGLEGMEDAEALALKADASAVRCIDGDAEEAFRNQIEEARARRDTVGGTFEVRVTGLVPGLG